MTRVTTGLLTSLMVFILVSNDRFLLRYLGALEGINFRYKLTSIRHGFWFTTINELILDTVITKLIYLFPKMK